MSEWSMEEEIIACVRIILREGNDRLINLMHRSMLDLATVAQSHNSFQWVDEAIADEQRKEGH